ncbi:YeeE/YedE family protein [Bdellovibrio svalbardensis]|uniref:YeeE/YedE family protein n=1 Tax=Bdellovibrio svalbardensis TaxID=2972972 RepID=A0ABT6DMD2_9BACT|nr:YeeE/YedE family protein [Bdellovibrio svalbardensis]MDG0817764.1 YeeE/YedE family protein [Bdellovibrio svalbardensis]
MLHSILMALFGGALIGLAASLMLVLNGRVTGISGITNGLLSFVKGDYAWRAAFVGGLLGGGFILGQLHPEFFENTTGRPSVMIAVAGLIVGFGTVLGSGCTSGHGVCGIARFSPRSLVATLVFMLVGMASATLLKAILG